MKEPIIKIEHAYTHDGHAKAAGSLAHCKYFFQPGRKIVRRMDYPALSR